MKTLQQEMAIKAHDFVTGVNEVEAQKYGTMAHKLPILIHTAGLAQALAFVEARQDPAQLRLLDHVARTIGMPGIANREQLARAARQAELSDYILLTRRTLQALLWYKRFVESILKVPARADVDTNPAGAGVTTPV